MVIVLSGGSAEDRQRAVAKIMPRLEMQPALRQRVLGRIGPTLVAEILFLMQPDALEKMRAELASDDFPALIEGGLPAWINSVEAKLAAGLDADGNSAPVDQKKVDDGFTHLATMLRALDKRIAQDDAMREFPNLGEGITTTRSIAIDQAGYVVGSRGDYHLIALFPDLAGAEGSDVQPLVATVRTIIADAKLDKVRARLTGMPALGSDELTLIRRGMWQTSLATSLVILALLYAAFRSFRYTMLALIPLGVGALLTLAVVRPLYGGLNLITSSFISLLLALGIDFGVFLLSRYGELVRDGKPPKDAISGALTKAGPGMLIGAVTTVMAFLMTTTTEFTAYRELGIITAIGLILMLAVTFLLLPALLWLLGRGSAIRSPELPGVAHVPGLVRRAPRLIVGVAILLIALGATQFGNIRFNPRYFDFLPEETESAQALRIIEKDAAVSPMFAQAMTESVEEARALAAKLRKSPAVAAVQTASDLLPPLDATGLAQLRRGVAGDAPNWVALRNRKRDPKAVTEALGELGDTLDEVAFALRQSGRDTSAVKKTQGAVHDLLKRIGSTAAAAERLAGIEQDVAALLERAWTTASHVAKRGHYLPQDLPPVFRARFVSKDGKALAVFANPAGDIWQPSTAREFNAQVVAVAPDASGLAINVFEHIQMIRDGFVRASLLSAAFVLLLLIASFRRLDDALMALMPCIVGIGWLFGLMGALNIDFNVANIIVLPLILGIGVDAGAHMTHRWRQSADENGGVADLDEIVRGTGAAVILASLTTGSGFAALLISDYGGMKSLGLTMSLGIGCCLLASVVVLPALLKILGRGR
jgi:predicted RND superfamily exporter protein